MDNHKPIFHITGEKGWINDPNGVIKFKGQYHVFYQHHPYSSEWGPMHWGHVVSDDLLHWKYLPFALVPGDEFDKDGCFSGSALIYDDKLYIAYTGFIFNEDPSKIIQHQCLAVSSDGIHFEKLGLIIGEDNLPKQYSINDFRDPCLYRENDMFFMLVAARKINGRGNIIKYQSKDLKNWTFVGEILKEDSTGSMIECPYYYRDLGLLMYSEQYQPIDGYMHHNLHSSFYKLGVFDDDEKFVVSKSGTLDYGFDYYAPQMFSNENILIAWMDMWDRDEPSRKYNFAGSLTIPRRVNVVNGDLYQTPILPKQFEQLDISNHYEEHVKVGFYKLDVNHLEDLQISIRKGQNYETTFRLNKDEWVFDRSRSGEVINGKETDEDSLNGIRRMPFDHQDKQEIYLLLDLYSVEIFVNGKPLTSLIYPFENSDLLSIDVKANNVNLYKYKGEAL